MYSSSQSPPENASHKAVYDEFNNVQSDNMPLDTLHNCACQKRPSRNNLSVSSSEGTNVFWAKLPDVLVILVVAKRNEKIGQERWLSHSIWKELGV